MEASFIPYLIAFMWMSCLLLLSIWMRAKCKWMQTYLVPSCILAGTLGCILMNTGIVGFPSPDGWVSLKHGSFGLLSFHLFSFGFGIIGLGCFSAATKGKTKSMILGALWVDLVFWLFYALQSTIGYGVMKAYNAITGSELNAATGFLAGLGFAFGPGQALTVSMAWENNYAMADSISMALAFAAAGFMVANLVGVPLANWGLRKGYATHASKELTPDFLLGLRQKKQQISAGPLTTHNGNVDTLALHFAVAGLVYGFGWLTCYILKYFILPPEYESASFGFIFMWALLAGAGIRLFINHTAAHTFYSDEIQNRILGSTIDFMIISALMAVNTTTVAKYAVPFLLVVLACTSVTACGVVWISRRSGAYGLERILCVFGLITGTLASGLALLRIVDSDFKTPVAAETGLNNVYSLIPMFPFLLVTVTMPQGFGISGMLIMNGIMVVLCVVALFVGHKMKIWGPRQF